MLLLSFEATTPALKALRPVLLIVGCLHLAIGSSNCLQLFAWASMLFNYSEGRSFAEAAEMTFDGDHPCSLCVAIEETRQDEKESPAPRPQKQLDRLELFPQQDIQPKNRRTILTANLPPSPARLLGHCRFVPELPTPPPRFV